MSPLHSAQDETAGSKELKQRAAECLLCIMSLLTALLSRLDHVDKCAPPNTAQQLSAVQVQSLRRHGFSLQTVCTSPAGACATSWSGTWSASSSGTSTHRCVCPAFE
jgi:hypothetical protein